MTHIKVVSQFVGGSKSETCFPRTVGGFEISKQFLQVLLYLEGLIAVLTG